MRDRHVTVAANGQGPYGQSVTAGRHRFVADKPETAGGGDAGPDPFEFVMAGLGACTSMAIRMYADRKGWPVRAVALRHRRRISGDGREQDVFERMLFVDGDLDDDQRRRLVFRRASLGLTQSRCRLAA